MATILVVDAATFPTDEYIPVAAFLSKPISPRELLRQVDRLLPAEVK